MVTEVVNPKKQTSFRKDQLKVLHWADGTSRSRRVPGTFWSAELCFFNVGAPLSGYAKGITPRSTALPQKVSHMVVNKACEEFWSRGSTRSAFDLAAATFEPVGVSITDTPAMFLLFNVGILPEFQKSDAAERIPPHKRMEFFEEGPSEEPFTGLFHTSDV